MRYLVAILALFICGCSGGYKHWVRVDDKLVLQEKFETWGGHHTIIEKDKVDTDSKVESPFRDIVNLSGLKNTL